MHKHVNQLQLSSKKTCTESFNSNLFDISVHKHVETLDCDVQLVFMMQWTGNYFLIFHCLSLKTLKNRNL